MGKSEQVDLKCHLRLQGRKNNFLVNPFSISFFSLKKEFLFSAVSGVPDITVGHWYDQFYPLAVFPSIPHFLIHRAGFNTSSYFHPNDDMEAGFNQFSEILNL
jgi:hypothetical protein